MLYGPPGSGKSKLAEFLCSIKGVMTTFKDLDSTRFSGGSWGDAQKKVKDEFEIATKNPNTLHIMFLDEFDSLGGDRNSVIFFFSKFASFFFFEIFIIQK